MMRVPRNRPETDLSGPEAAPLQCTEPAAGGAQLRQTLRVVAVREGHAELEGGRAKACSGCVARSGCGTGALAELIGGEAPRLRLPQTLPLKPGDEVVVAMPRATFLSAALRAYLLPPASLAGAAVGSAALGLSDLQTALLCLPVLALSFLPLVLADRRGRVLGSLRIEGLAPRDAG